MVATLPSSARLIVNVVGKRPEKLPYRPAVESGPSFDLILEGEDVDDSDASWLAELEAVVENAERRDRYIVEPIVEMNRQTTRSIGVSPAIKYIGLLQFHADLPASAARRRNCSTLWMTRSGTAISISKRCWR